jgi:2-dehydro-3-deoxygluconokinase
MRHDRLLTIGECMVEMAPDGAGKYTLGFAGDTLNTAWYARRLLPMTHAVDYLTAVGTDEISDRMVEFFADAGIGTAAVARVPDRTVGLYLIRLTDGERSFAYWRSVSAARTLAADRPRLDAALAPGGVLFLSGITLAILPPGDREHLLDALAAARRDGAFVAFDTNLRPRLWEGMAEAAHWLARAGAVADLVLPSFDEAQMAFGDAAPEATAARFLGLGAAMVAVKNGAGDVIVQEAGAAPERLPVAPVQPVDSTAAGDSFDAGFLAALMQGRPPLDAAAEGAALARHVVRHRGALVAPP